MVPRAERNGIRNRRGSRVRARIDRKGPYQAFTSELNFNIHNSIWQGTWGDRGLENGIEVHTHHPNLCLLVPRSLACDLPLTSSSITQMANVQDNYLLEIRGDVNSSLDPSQPQDETMDQDESADGDKVYYVVHPQVDLSDLSSSLPGV